MDDNRVEVLVIVVFCRIGVGVILSKLETLLEEGNPK